MSYSTMYYYYRLLLYDGILLRPSSFIVALKNTESRNKNKKFDLYVFTPPFRCLNAFWAPKAQHYSLLCFRATANIGRALNTPLYPLVNSKLIQPNSDLFVFFFRFVQGRSGIVWMPILVSNESYVIFFFFIIELSILNASKEEELSLVFCIQVFTGRKSWRMPLEIKPNSILTLYQYSLFSLGYSCSQGVTGRY